MVPGIPSEQCGKVGQICPKMQVNTCKVHALYRVRIGPGKPGKSWNFILVFSRTGKSWKKATGPGKFWKSIKLN